MYLIKSNGCGIATRHQAKYFFQNKHGCDYYLIMCFHTDFVYYSDGEMRHGRKCQCLIHPPHAPIIHGPEEYLTEGFENDWIYFSGEYVGELLQELKLPLNESFSVENSNYLAHYIGTVIKECKLPSHFSDQYCSVVIYEMLVNVARKRAVYEFRNSDTYALMQYAREEMLSNSGDKVNLEKLAGKTGYSVSRFCELYRHFYHSSPIADLINVRIHDAKNMLLLTEKSVGEIAQLCGFDSIHYFSKIFKGRVGCSPTQYRMYINKERKC